MSDEKYASTSYKRSDGVRVYEKRKKPGPVRLIIPAGAPPPSSERLAFVEKENARIERMNDLEPRYLRPKKGNTKGIRKALADDLPPATDTTGHMDGDRVSEVEE